MSDRATPVPELDELRAEAVEVNAEGTAPEPLGRYRDKKEVFEHRSLLRGDIAAGETPPGLSRVRDGSFRSASSEGGRRHAATRDNPAVGIMSIIPRAG